ncbi:MAG: FAD-dependent monooxygenase [Jatrophihabitans sp.]|nr:MAG: FAD-dependent monooxygenase [Jatrophihabitans sp.]
MTGVEQGDDAVLLHTTADAVRARWVIGADGAHSDLRRCFAVAFDGDTYPTLSLVAATRFPFEHADLAPVSYWTGPLGRVSLIRTPDAWRIAVSTSEPASEPPPGADVPHPTLRAALDRLAGGPGWQSYPIEQHQFYRSHQRVAATFRSGRLVLAGDAAHLTSTTGGMGLNSGVHDAVDLATRLGPALAAGDAEAQERAVARYAAVHRAVACGRVQPVTRAARAAVDARDVAARAARLADLRAAAADPRARLRHLRQASMLADDVSGA